MLSILFQNDEACVRHKGDATTEQWESKKCTDLNPYICEDLAGILPLQYYMYYMESHTIHCKISTGRQVFNSKTFALSIPKIMALFWVIYHLHRPQLLQVLT